MKRLLLILLVGAGALAGCCVPATTPTPPDDVHVEICPPYCGDDQPVSTTSPWSYDPTPPPDACIGYDGDDDLHVVDCDSPGAVQP